MAIYILIKCMYLFRGEGGILQYFQGILQNESAFPPPYLFSPRYKLLYTITTRRKEHSQNIKLPTFGYLNSCVMKVKHFLLKKHSF